MNASATSCCSLAPVDLGARVELAVLDPPRRRRERAQRPRERAGEHPGEREPERERGEADADDDEHVPAHALADRLDALRDAHGADRPALVDDRHRGVEQLVAERVALPRPLLGAAGERGGDLGPVAYEVSRSPRRRSRRAAALPVDDDHARAEVAAGVLDDAARSCARSSSAAGRRRRDDLRLRGRLRAHLGVDPAREAERERDLERDQDEHEHVGERGEQAAAQAHRELLRRGEAEADAAHGVDVARLRVVAELLAQRAHVDVERLRRAEPVHVPDLVDQPLARDDRPRLPHQQREQVELLARELERLAVERDACGAPGRAGRAPISIGPSAAAGGRCARRSTARIRAITSRALNGLTT